MSDQLAIDRYRSIARWRTLWTTLIFALGATTIGFLVASIVLLFHGSPVVGGITGLATILSGGAVRWVEIRRQEAAKEETEAYDAATRAKQEATKEKKEERAADRRATSRDVLLGTLNSRE